MGAEQEAGQHELAGKKHSGEGIDRQQDYLIALGYFQKQEFQFTNRFWDGTNGAYLNQCMTHTFDKQIYWSCKFLTANKKFEVVAPPEDMPKWKKLVADFDR